MVIANAYFFIFLARGIAGCGESFISPLVGPYIKSTAPLKQYGMWIGIYSAALPMGAAIGYIVGGLTTYLLHWRYAYIFELFVYISCFYIFSLFPDAEDIKGYSGADNVTLTCKPFVNSETSNNNNNTIDCENDNDNIDHLILSNEISDNTQGNLVIEEDEFHHNGNKYDNNGEIEEINDIVLSGIVNTKDKFALRKAAKSLWNNRAYISIVFGCSALNFVAGTLGFWGPIYIQEELGVSILYATLSVGIFTVIFGIVGSFTGGKMVDYLSKNILEYETNTVIDNREQGNIKLYIRKFIFSLGSYTKIPTFDKDNETKQLCWVKIMVGCRFVIFLSIFQLILLVSIPMTSSFPVFLVLFALTEFILFCMIAPVNALVMDVVEKGEREFAVGLQIGISHLLGDFPSPMIIGFVRQLYGLKTGMFLMAIWFIWVIYWFFSTDKYFRARDSIINLRISKQEELRTKIISYAFIILPYLIMLYLILALFLN